MRKIVAGLVVTSFSFTGYAGGLGSFFTTADKFLKEHVNNGAVDYAAIKKNIAEAETLYKQIGAVDLANAGEAEKKAFYINAYNLVVIYFVSRHYPLKSPLDASGFFDKVRHKVAGEDLTLNALEIKKLLQPYKDARVHFVLACAARSCPPLASFAYLPEKLDRQLDARTTLALNDPDWIKVRKDKKTVELSKIFDWYKNDFTGEGTSAIDWINRYRREKIPAAYKVGYYEYNWALNEQ